MYRPDLADFRHGYAEHFGGVFCRQILLCRLRLFALCENAPEQVEQVLFVNEK
jgi:hypothetical protein